METSKLRSVWISRTSGIFSRMTGSSVRMAAAMAGRAAFLAPLTRMVPTSGLPPRITNLSIRLSDAALLPFSPRGGRKGIEIFFSSRALPKDFLLARKFSRAGLLHAPNKVHLKSLTLDSFSYVSLNRFESFLGLAPVQVCLQH